MYRICFIVLMLTFVGCNKVPKENQPTSLVQPKGLDQFKLTGTSWSISTIIAHEGTVNKELYLTKIPKQDTEDFFPNGNFIHFNTNGTFTCDYAAECGNDCFPESNGKYSFIGAEQLAFKVDSFATSGFCDEIHLNFKPNELVYDIIQTSDSTFVLKNKKGTLKW